MTRKDSVQVFKACPIWPWLGRTVLALHQRWCVERHMRVLRRVVPWLELLVVGLFFWLAWRS